METESNDSLVQRNRHPAALGGGPRSASGKLRSRRNSLRHGLYANPAAGAVEDPRRFRRLHARLVEQFGPSGELEAALVKRIADCLWRLERAARADTAMTEMAVRSVVPQREQVQEWIERINEAWRVELVAESDPDLLKQRREEGLLKPGEKWHRPMRPGLATLDGFRDRAMMRSSAALMAMAVMIRDLIEELGLNPQLFVDTQGEKLAWLLGDKAVCFPRCDRIALIL